MAAAAGSAGASGAVSRAAFRAARSQQLQQACDLAVDLIAAVDVARTPKQQRLAAKALEKGTWTMGVPKVLFVVAGGDEVLATALTEWKDEKAKYMCLKIIYRLRDSAVRFLDANIIPALIDAIPLKNALGDHMAVHILLHFAKRFPRTLTTMRKHPGCTCRLEELDTEDARTLLENLKATEADANDAEE